MIDVFTDASWIINVQKKRLYINLVQKLFQLCSNPSVVDHHVVETYIRITGIRSRDCFWRKLTSLCSKQKMKRTIHIAITCCLPDNIFSRDFNVFFSKCKTHLALCTHNSGLVKKRNRGRKRGEFLNGEKNTAVFWHILRFVGRNIILWFSDLNSRTHVNCCEKERKLCKQVTTLLYKLYLALNAGMWLY